MAGCFRCGECCHGLGRDIRLSPQEYKQLNAIIPFPAKITKTFSGIVKFLMPNPCPFYKAGKCSQYAIRPTMCRMYHCGRKFPGDKPRIWVYSDLQELMIRDREFAMFLINMENEAAQYGNTHGWQLHRNDKKFDKLVRMVVNHGH